MRFKTIEDVSAESGESASFPHLKELRNGDLAASAIKQVASGRFGVTPEYLVSAEQASTLVTSFPVECINGDDADGEVIFFSSHKPEWAVSLAVSQQHVCPL